MNTVGYAYFWSGLFSQWEKFKIKDRENIEYNCCEQYMMAHKAMPCLTTRLLVNL